MSKRKIVDESKDKMAERGGCRRKMANNNEKKVDG